MTVDPADIQVEIIGLDDIIEMADRAERAERLLGSILENLTYLGTACFTVDYDGLVDRAIDAFFELRDYDPELA